MWYSSPFNKLPTLCHWWVGGGGEALPTQAQEATTPCLLPPLRCPPAYRYFRAIRWDAVLLWRFAHCWHSLTTTSSVVVYDNACNSWELNAAIGCLDALRNNNIRCRAPRCHAFPATCTPGHYLPTRFHPLPYLIAFCVIARAPRCACARLRRVYPPFVVDRAAAVNSNTYRQRTAIACSCLWFRGVYYTWWWTNIGGMYSSGGIVTLRFAIPTLPTLLLYRAAATHTHAPPHAATPHHLPATRPPPHHTGDRQRCTFYTSTVLSSP